MTLRLSLHFQTSQASILVLPYVRCSLHRVALYETYLFPMRRVTVILLARLCLASSLTTTFSILPDTDLYSPATVDEWHLVTLVLGIIPIRIKSARTCLHSVILLIILYRVRRASQ